MMGKKTKSGVILFIKKFLFIAILAAVVVGILFGTWYFTGGGWLGGIPSTFKIAVDGTEYGKTFIIPNLYSGTEFQVKRLFGEDYALEISAAKDTGARLTVEDESFAWEETEADFNKGFMVELHKNGFTVSYESLESIIASATGYENFELTEGTSAELFLMTIKCANAEIEITFGVGVTVTEIELDRDQVVFGAIY